MTQLDDEQAALTPTQALGNAGYSLLTADTEIALRLRAVPSSPAEVALRVTADVVANRVAAVVDGSDRFIPKTTPACRKEASEGRLAHLVHRFCSRGICSSRPREAALLAARFLGVEPSKGTRPLP